MKTFDQVFKEEIGCEVRHYRQLRKMTQRDLAQKTKIDQGYISRLENGRANIDLIKLIDICESLRVAISLIIKSKQFYLERQDEIHNVRRQKWN